MHLIHMQLVSNASECSGYILNNWITVLTGTPGALFHHYFQCLPSQSTRPASSRPSGRYTPRKSLMSCASSSVWSPQTTPPSPYWPICLPQLLGIELDEDVCITFLCYTLTVFLETYVKHVSRLLSQNGQLWMENRSSPSWRSRFQRTGSRSLCRLVWIIADLS